MKLYPAILLSLFAASVQADSLTSTNALPGTEAKLVINDSENNIDLVVHGQKPICSPGVCGAVLIIDGNKTSFSGYPIGPREDEGIRLKSPEKFKKAIAESGNFKVVLQFVTHGNGVFEFQNQQENKL